MSNQVFTIDGSMGEGGGQILRISLAISAVTGKPVRIYNIRAKRSKPGLRPQHLIAVKALAEISSAEVKGAEIGSTELVFKPGRIKGGSYRFDIGTAGSVSLVIQAILLPLLFAGEPSNVRLTGGTDVPMAPPIDYMRYVFKSNLRLLGASFDIVLHRRGHYPKGGGVVELTVDKPLQRLRPVKAVERGEILEIRGLSHAVRLPFHVASRQALAARKYLREKLGEAIPVSIELEHYKKEWDPHLGPGSGIVLWANCGKTILGSDSLGARGKPAERVGEEAASILFEDLSTGMAFDRHMSDMLPVFLAFTGGHSEIGGSRLTSHAETILKVLGILVGDDGFEYRVEGTPGAPFTLSVEGIEPPV
ncbi:MAG: RNA 3'-terminal phosphate cyclase [Desulfurococcales archaeon]|nr:RNA 3'-terminal phosphate cyclase [Desulfurococcales archaeon]MEB3772429.1 RNA 3'-terminal phosphate cyclase [Desulfurococcales archaeon]MEB3799323.1 RNA 3'-terminal phosphate cyclase [Desulfurococcales archaeon]MEB3845949.1 RNA 3'-terminal phosphate cyclase [Desulfurococcales archaeon]